MNPVDRFLSVVGGVLSVLYRLVYLSHIRSVRQVLETGGTRLDKHLAGEHVLVGVRRDHRHLLVQHGVGIDPGIQLETRSVLVIGGQVNDMLPILIRLVSYGDNRISRLWFRASSIAIRDGKIYVILADMDHPSPVILVAHVMGHARLHVELTALRQVVNGELVHDLLVTVGLPEITPVSHFPAVHRGQYLLAGGIKYLHAHTVIYDLVLRRHLLHTDTFHPRRGKDDSPSHVREMLDLKRIEIRFQPHVQLVDLHVGLSGLGVPFQDETRAERTGGEILRLDVIRYQAA